MQKSTDELLKILKEKKSYNEFLDQEFSELFFTTASEYLEMLLKEKGVKKSEAIEKSNLDKNYAYQIFNGIKTNPSRNKVLMLSFGIGLTIEETQKLLKIFCISELYARNPRDTIILFCLNKRKNLIETNEILNEFSLDLLE